MLCLNLLTDMLLQKTLKKKHSKPLLVVPVALFRFFNLYPLLSLLSLIDAKLEDCFSNFLLKKAINNIHDSVPFINCICSML